MHVGECFLHFSSVLKYPSVLKCHLLYDMDFTRAMQNNKPRFFYVSYSDKTWVFYQSERVRGRIYVIK